MTYVKRLVFVELAAQIALLICSLLFGLLFGAAFLFSSISSPGETADPIAMAQAAGAFALLAYLYTVGSVVLVVAPLYAWIEAMGRSSILASLAIGLVPGLLVLCVSSVVSLDGAPLSGLTLSCLTMGSSVTLATYVVRTWRSGTALPPNKSLERTRER